MFNVDDIQKRARKLSNNSDSDFKGISRPKSGTISYQKNVSMYSNQENEEDYSPLKPGSLRKLLEKSVDIKKKRNQIQRRHTVMFNNSNMREYSSFQPEKKERFQAEIKEEEEIENNKIED